MIELSRRSQIQFSITSILFVYFTLGNAEAGFFDCVKKVGSGIVDVVKDVGGAVGEIVGAPFGGFVDSATSPTIRNAEGAGHRLIADVDGRMKERIDQVDSVLGKQIDNGVEKLDTTLEKRIFQLKEGLDDVLKSNLLEVDRITAARVAELDGVIGKNIDKVDASLKSNIAEVDKVLEARVQQVDTVLKDAIADADDRIKQRIEQLDEVAETRIGNIDVVATRASLSFEESFERLILVGCILIFVSFLAWRVFVANQSASDLNPVERTKHIWRTAKWRLLGEGAVGMLGVLLIYGSFAVIPGGPRARSQRVLAAHEGEFHQSLAAFDLRRARFHAAQLQLLVQDGAASSTYRGLLLKTEVIRDVLERPGVLQSPDGVATIAQRIINVSSYLPNDPDVATLQAYVLWRTGDTRLYEYEAARICSIAIDERNRIDRGDFALLPLAHFVLESYLHNPLPDSLVSELLPTFGVDPKAVKSISSLVASMQATKDFHEVDQVKKESLPVIQHIVQYGAMVRELDTASTKNYVEMLKAHARCRSLLAPNTNGATPSENTTIADTIKPGDPPGEVNASWNELQKAKFDRYRYAYSVIEAWRNFDQRFNSDFWMKGTNLALANFQLNDAVFTRAMWFVIDPDVADNAPSISGFDFGDAVKRNADQSFVDPAKASLASKLMRMLPPRLVWRQRCSPMLTRGTWVIVDHQEATRFKRFEKGIKEYEDAAVTFYAYKDERVGEAKIKPAGIEAAKKAAVAGLFVASDSDTAIPVSVRMVSDMIESFGKDTTFPASAEKAELDGYIEKLMLPRRLRLL